MTARRGLHPQPPPRVLFRTRGGGGGERCPPPWKSQRLTRTKVQDAVAMHIGADALFFWAHPPMRSVDNGTVSLDSRSTRSSSRTGCACSGTPQPLPFVKVQAHD